MAAEIVAAGLQVADVYVASMRPRRMAAEIPSMAIWSATLTVASMRPRRMAAEIVVPSFARRKSWATLQ